MGDYKEWPVDWLVTSDDYYPEFQAKLGDPNERDRDGNTLLHVAAQSSMDNSRIVQLLLDLGADVDSTNPDGHTPLHIAVSSRKRESVIVLIEAGASVNSKDLLGSTALHLAVCKGQSYRPSPVPISDCDIWIVEKLLCHPEININPVDNGGETPLVWAVKEWNWVAVGALLKKWANVDMANYENQTPLHVALSAENSSSAIVAHLLISGAGIYCKDISQQTPVDILVRYVRADDLRTLRFAKIVVRLIALRYNIRNCLWLKLERIRELYNYFKECLEEVSFMKKAIIFDKFTLHDFCLDCFETRVENQLIEINRPVMTILHTGVFKIYYDLIRGRLSSFVMNIFVIP